MQNNKVITKISNLIYHFVSGKTMQHALLQRPATPAYLLETQLLSLPARLQRMRGKLLTRTSRTVPRSTRELRRRFTKMLPLNKVSL
jgi:hypothetical protein